MHNNVILLWQLGIQSPYVPLSFFLCKHTDDVRHELSNSEIQVNNVG